jgi:hypothetical protein
LACNEAPRPSSRPSEEMIQIDGDRIIAEHERSEGTIVP